MSYFKPRFNHKYLLNYLALLFVFVGFFSFVSIAQAFENDGSWNSGSYYQISNCLNSGYCAVSPTKSEVCSKQNLGFNGSSCTSWNGSTYSIATLQCGSGSNPVDAQCGVSPDPVEPESCSDLQTQYPDPFLLEYEGGYEVQFCNKGCVMKDSGNGSADFGSYVMGDYSYTGGDCNGGFNADSPVEKIDTYAHDDELQNCHDSTGKLIGQISIDLSCPSLSICYDASTGQSTGTTSSSTSCQSGVKYNELTQAQKDALKTSSTTNSTTVAPDGTVTDTTETTTTETALDGSVTSETTTDTTTTNPDGSTTSETKTDKKTEDCTGDKCTEKAIKNLDNCSKSLQCSGDIFQCQQLRIEKDRACALSEDSLKSWSESDDFKNKVFGDGDVDAKGQLTALDGGTIDVSASLNVTSWMKDDGVTAACPAPIPAGSYSIDITPFCTFMNEIRIVVIFFNAVAIIWFFRRSLLEKD